MDFDYAVIGAGVVGLAVAAELAPRGSLIVLEKAEKFGQGTSSRNSEVIHAGLYYQPGSLKARLCIEGRKIIEELSAQEKFGYKRVGKYIVATDERERALLEQLHQNALACGVEELRWADIYELDEREPDVQAVAALFSPNTGIVDSHGMMNHFRMAAMEAGAEAAFGATVVGIRRLGPPASRGATANNEPSKSATPPFTGGTKGGRCVPGWESIAPHVWDRAQKMRGQMTHAEVILWKALRRGQLGVRFRRQHPIGPFIVDFYCAEANLVVELDGNTHVEPEQIQDDEERTCFLGSCGLRVMRFFTPEVENNLAYVIDQIRGALSASRMSAKEDSPPLSPPRERGGENVASPVDGGGYGYEITVNDGTTFTAKCVINSAGLYADRVAEMAGMDVRALGLELQWSRGVYYGIAREAGVHITHLIYPVPDHARASLGVHVCVDLNGGIRFGPTAEYLNEKIEDYAPPTQDIERVAEGLSRYLPKVRADYLYPVMVGIRPKLSGPGEPVRDFYIQEESKHGLPGFVNLIGIESPGLTAAPAIAKHAARLIN